MSGHRFPPPGPAVPRPPGQDGGGSLCDAVRAVLRAAVDTYRDQPRTADLLRRQLARLDEPLRVAIAGKVKAGKSTLLNALVGDAVAATDAGECTRVVTWYRDGPTPRVVAHPTGGEPRPLPVVRRDGALEIDLAGTPADGIDRLVVDWPAQSLRAMTLIDTPGIASLSTGTALRTVRFLDPDDDTPTEADAVVYLMRHLHAADADFLESFRDGGHDGGRGGATARAAGVNTVAVVSRADEIGGGRVDAMFSARAIAARYRAEPALRGLCQHVVPVAGLLAFTGRTLRTAEVAALTALAAVPRDELAAALLSTDRFLRVGPNGPNGPDAPAGGGTAAPEPGVTALPVDTRRRLLDRFGLFGIRLSTALIRQGVRDPAALAGELVARSGLLELQHVLHTRFAERRDLLKARSALLALDRVLRADPRDGGRLAGHVERIMAGAHEFAELRLLGELRSGTVGLPAALAAEAERLLGATGTTPHARLGLPDPDRPGAGASAAELRSAAERAWQHWQRNAENPMFGRRAADACRVLVRTCDGILARLTAHQRATAGRTPPRH